MFYLYYVSILHPPHSNSKGRLPLVSSVDLVECEYKFKPGRGVFGLWKDNPSLKDLIYCLLHGRPLVIVGKQNDERYVSVETLVGECVLSVVFHLQYNTKICAIAVDVHSRSLQVRLTCC